MEERKQEEHLGTWCKPEELLARLTELKEHEQRCDIVIAEELSAQPTHPRPSNSTPSHASSPWSQLVELDLDRKDPAMAICTGQYLTNIFVPLSKQQHDLHKECSLDTCGCGTLAMNSLQGWLCVKDDFIPRLTPFLA
eukprot:scaffold8512_cov23-Tisochrysis_lutea.AAC.1